MGNFDSLVFFLRITRKDCNGFKIFLWRIMVIAFLESVAFADVFGYVLFLFSIYVSCEGVFFLTPRTLKAENPLFLERIFFVLRRDEKLRRAGST